ncbi:MAG: ATP-binding protein [Coriobacteriia bacterium]|nr:ATP-binding protein [Coriobacteriia bacterium]
MAGLRRPSVRLWQTELFVIVIVVAILILSVSLSQGLQQTLKRLGESDRLSDASALASQLSAEFPLTVESRARIRTQIRHHREIYGDEVWVFGVDGSVIDSAHTGGPPANVLEEARIQGLADSPPYSQMTLKPGGYVVAGKAIYERNGRRAASVVIAGPVTQSLAVLDSVRDQLWNTFWIALIVSGLLGLGFAEFIGRRVRQMSKAAAAIAGGDFDQQLPTGLIPDEIYELAESYNRMAITLGEAFSTLHEREQEIAAVVESMGEGVVAFDSAGMIRVINPEAILLLGLEGEPMDMASRHLTDLTADPAILDLVDRGLAGPVVSDIVTLEDRTVLLHSTPIVSTEGTVEGAVLLMSDITEQKRLEEAQRRFVANASHEMRTPISALKGLLELLTGGAKDDPDVRDDFLRTMTLEVDRLGRLVADLLTLAQLEAGNLILHREPVPVAGLLDEVATVMRPLADRSSVALVVEAPDDGIEALCDRDRVMQVLLGFVDNALKHSSSGTVVTLRGAVDGSVVSLEVQDQGIGIDPESVPRLFDRFFRVDESRATPRGTGLGLSIAKEIVEAHDSTIAVRSRLGAGATFSFDLPLAKRS